MLLKTARYWEQLKRPTRDLQSLVQRSSGNCAHEQKLGKEVHATTVGRESVCYVPTNEWCPQRPGLSPLRPWRLIPEPSKITTHVHQNYVSVNMTTYTVLKPWCGRFSPVSPAGGASPVLTWNESTYCASRFSPLCFSPSLTLHGWLWCQLHFSECSCPKVLQG